MRQLIQQRQAGTAIMQRACQAMADQQALHWPCCCSVKMGPGGMDALVALGGGDMRRSLNIVQSCHMAFDQVDEEAVYLCTGNPMPQDIQSIVHWLFNDSFKEAYSKISDMQVGGAGTRARPVAGLTGACAGQHSACI
jgi:hypothetical protein